MKKVKLKVGLAYGISGKHNKEVTANTILCKVLQQTTTYSYVDNCRSTQVQRDSTLSLLNAFVEASIDLL